MVLIWGGIMSTTNINTSKNDIFTIARVFNASREDVWKAWTQENQAKHWFGPKGCTANYKIFDFHPGGAAFYSIEFNGEKMFGKWTYKEIKKPEKFVAIVSFTDETGKKILPHPGMPGWPREVFSIVNFKEKGNKTEVVIEWSAHNPTKIERETFANNHASMQGGWGGSLDQLEAFLEKK